MEDGMKKSESGKPKDGENGKEGEKEGQGEGDGKSGKNGKNGNEGDNGSKQGEGENGSNEELNGELYRIYQQQQQIRQALQDRLAKEGKMVLETTLLSKWSKLKWIFLNKGFTNKTMEKMMNLQHQLLKMDNATFQQGQEEKRESQSNKKQFDNKTNNQIPTAKQ